MDHGECVECMDPDNEVIYRFEYGSTTIEWRRYGSVTCYPPSTELGLSVGEMMGLPRHGRGTITRATECRCVTWLWSDVLPQDLIDECKGSTQEAWHVLSRDAVRRLRAGVGE